MRQRETTVLRTYTLQIIGPDSEWRQDDRHVHDELMREAEENLTDLLPTGHEVRIREWDAKEDE